MRDATLTVAVVTDVFPESADWDRLVAVAQEAREGGAELVILPELPLNPWSPRSKELRDEDAEEEGGPRHRALAAAARKAGVGVVGGAIVRHPRSGNRYNTALVFDPRGRLVARYRKVHLPYEEGYWEADHYRPGQEPPRLVEGFPLRLGLQICSDVNRPTGCELLAALGAEVIVAPRCTPAETYERWRLVLRANAVMASAYLISTNRPTPPSPRPGESIGGPSVAIAPDGEVLLETTQPLAWITLRKEAVSAAREAYPGYLARYPRLYARGWQGVDRGETRRSGDLPA